MWNDKQREQVIAALESKEGITIEEILTQYPPSIPPEKAWDIAARDKVRDFLGKRKAYSVFLKAMKSRRAYRLAKKMSPSELKQVEAECLEATDQYLEKRFRIRKLRESIQEIAKSQQKTVVNKGEFVAEQQRELERVVASAQM